MKQKISIVDLQGKGRGFDARVAQYDHNFAGSKRETATHRELRELLSIAIAQRNTMANALASAYQIPYAPSQNGPQWDEGHRKGWEAALSGVYSIALEASVQTGTL